MFIRRNKEFVAESLHASEWQERLRIVLHVLVVSRYTINPLALELDI